MLVWMLFVAMSLKAIMIMQGRLWAYFSFVFSSIYAGLFKTKESLILFWSHHHPFCWNNRHAISLFKRTPFVFEIRDLWPESAIDTGVLKNKLILFCLLV